MIATESERPRDGLGPCEFPDCPDPWDVLGSVHCDTRGHTQPCPGEVGIRHHLWLRSAESRP